MMRHLPNILTVSRILLVLLFTVVLAVDGALSPLRDTVSGGWFEALSWASAVAVWAFIAGAITDFLDGYLARKYNVVSDFGKLMDPLADKILVGAAFIYLSTVGMCPFWVTILIIFREFLVTGLRQLAVAKGYVMAADRWGKWKTAIQLVFCIACLANLAYGGNLPEPLCSLSIGAGGEWLRCISLWLSVVLTVFSGLNYCVQARRFLA